MSYIVVPASVVTPSSHRVSPAATSLPRVPPEVMLMVRAADCDTPTSTSAAVALFLVDEVKLSMVAPGPSAQNRPLR